MRFLTKSLLIGLVLAMATPAFADGKKKRKAAGGKGGGYQRVLSGEGTLKKDQTKLDLDSADIGGRRKLPMGDTISSNKSDKNYDFVKIRLRWHPEMVQSASALDAGDTK